MLCVLGILARLFIKNPLAKVGTSSTNATVNVCWFVFGGNNAESFSVIAVELEHRIDFELREGLVESRYWSAVTSHTAYWNSHDVALFLLTFIYKSQSTSETCQDNPDPE